MGSTLNPLFTKELGTYKRMFLIHRRVDAIKTTKKSAFSPQMLSEVEACPFPAFNVKNLHLSDGLEGVYLIYMRTAINLRSIP